MRFRSTVENADLDNRLKVFVTKNFYCSAPRNCDTPNFVWTRWKERVDGRFGIAHPEISHPNTIWIRWWISMAAHLEIWHIIYERALKGKGRPARHIAHHLESWSSSQPNFTLEIFQRSAWPLAGTKLLLFTHARITIINTHQRAHKFSSPQVYGILHNPSN